MGNETAKRELKKVVQGTEGKDRLMPEVVKRWCDLLSEEGYRPTPDQKEGATQYWFIGFKQEGTKFGIYLDEKDPTFTQLELAYTVDPSVAPVTVLLAIANEINTETKGVKVTVSPSGDCAWFQLEWFSETVPSPDLLDRLLMQARTAAREFFEKREAQVVPGVKA